MVWDRTERRQQQPYCEQHIQISNELTAPKTTRTEQQSKAVSSTRRPEIMKFKL